MVGHSRIDQTPHFHTKKKKKKKKKRLDILGCGYGTAGGCRGIGCGVDVIEDDFQPGLVRLRQEAIHLVHNQKLEVIEVQRRCRGVKEGGGGGEINAMMMMANRSKREGNGGG